MDLHQHPTRPNVFVAPNGRVFVEAAASPSEGYHTVKVGRETIRRHVLVAETFLDPEPGATLVRHLDGDSYNDAPSNLAWGTHESNAADAIRHGTTTRGERNARAVLTRDQAAEILRRRRSGESGKALAVEFGVASGTVCDIYHRRTWPELEPTDG